MIRITDDVVVQSARVPGSWTRYKVWVEKSGVVVGPVHETTRPADVEHALAYNVCHLMGRPRQDTADVLFGVLVGILTSPWVWGALALAALL